MASDRPKPVSLREQRRRQVELMSETHLLDAAERVFAEKGYVGATMKEIADAAEFSVGALYNFFPGKEGLFAAVMSRRNVEFTAIFATALAGEAPARARLRMMIDVSCDYYLDQRPFMRLFQQAIGRAWLNIKSSFNEENYHQYEEIMAMEAAVFRVGIASGEIRDGDPEMMAAVFAGAVQAYLARRILDEGDAGDERASRKALIAMLERAFLRRP
jgi:TetR/AcrR family transcriptional regulator